MGDADAAVEAHQVEEEARGVFDHGPHMRSTVLSPESSQCFGYKLGVDLGHIGII